MAENDAQQGATTAADSTSTNTEQVTGGAAEGTLAGGAQGSADQSTQAAPGAAATTDWRDRVAGGDAAFRKRLDRFSDEAAFAKSYRALESKLSSGEVRSALPENPTPEQLAQWRKDNGVPDKPDEYVAKIALPNNAVLGEADKPIVGDFAKFAHDRNWTPTQFNEALNWYYGNIDKQRASVEDADANYQRSAEDTLRTEWEGPNYRRNLTAVSNMLSGWPQEARDALLAGRGPDGRKLGDNPHVIKQLAAMALEINPAITAVPASAGDSVKGMHDRIAEIERMIAQEPNRYWKDEALQADYRSLLEARNKINARAA